MKLARQAGLVAGALALVVGFAGSAGSDEKAAKPAGTLVMRSGEPADASARPDLSGTWKLDESLSEDPRKKMEEAGAGPGGGMGGGGGMGDGSGARRLNESLEAQKVLKISHKDPRLVIADLSGRARTLFTDARTVEEERTRGTAKIQAMWKDRSIVVVTTFGEREVTETYERKVGEARLVVTTKVAGGRAPYSYRRAYDAVLKP